MPTFDARSATCRVFTEKEGLLARLAHDLELDVTRFEIRAEADRVEASFDPRSLRVLHALHGGTPTGALSDWDKRSIEGNIAREVLTSEAPIQFTSSALVRTDAGGTVRGTLTINARACPVEAEVRRDGAQLVTEIRLRQLDWGILPYEAMLGAIKIKPHVRVRIAMPAWE